MHGVLVNSNGKQMLGKLPKIRYTVTNVGSVERQQNVLSVS